ncbi:uncharacterized protein LOC144751197 [Ciona intestinalis]
MATRAPKQWCLTQKETINTFDNWKNNLLYILSSDPNFSPFLGDQVTWLKQNKNTPTRGLVSDNNEVPEANRKTEQQKVTQLNLMLGQIANFCPVISRNTIVKNSVSIPDIWQKIRTQSTGAHFLDFSNIQLEVDERPEDLFQKITSFVEVNLLTKDCGITHHNSAVTEDEELTPMVENMIVLHWLQCINQDLPRLVKQRYGTELRSRTLASIKPEISQAMDSLLEEINCTNEIKVMRSMQYKRPLRYNTQPSTAPDKQYKAKMTCALCQACGRKTVHHFLSKCPYLPTEDKKYMAKLRSIEAKCNENTEVDSGDSDCYQNCRAVEKENCEQSINQVRVGKAPYLSLFFQHKPLQLILDSGAEANLIKQSLVEELNLNVSKSSQKACQADGTPLQVLGEIRINLERDNYDFHLEALVVQDLENQILAGIPFLSHNDISLRPAKHEIFLADGHKFIYNKDCKRSRCIQRSLVLRNSIPQVVFPGEFLELSLPPNEPPDASFALEPIVTGSKKGCIDNNRLWPNPNLLTAVGNTIRIINDSPLPQHLSRHDHIGKILPIQTKELALDNHSVIPPVPIIQQTTKCSQPTLCQIDPDQMLTTEQRANFSELVSNYSEVFKPEIGCYNNAFGSFEAEINMGKREPPQRKGRLPQYSRNRMVELQEKFDELEKQGVFRKPEEVGVKVEYLNPSFLINKPNGGTRLVTSFGEVGYFSKPQPSLLPNVDSILRQISSWKYIIITDLSNAFYQIPLAKSAMKYCGVSTPFRGTRVYTRCAMGMPGSETSLEELMCRILGDLHCKGNIAKLADDLYCGDGYGKMAHYPLQDTQYPP